MLALVGGAPAGARTPAPPWKVTRDPFRLSFRPVTGGRFAYRLADGSLHGLGAVLNVRRRGASTEYRVATDEPARDAVVDVAPTKTGARVSFSLKPATQVVETTVAFAGRAGEHFLGGGERQQALDLSGQSFPVKASSACVTPMPAPF